MTPHTEDRKTGLGNDSTGEGRKTGQHTAAPRDSGAGEGGGA